MKQRLGCFTVTGIITAVLSFIIIGGVTLVRGSVLFSAGPLNAQGRGQPLGSVLSHAELSTNCAACHPAPWQSKTMSDLCINCHPDVVQNPLNFHRSIVNEKSSCRSCHTDHRGATASMTIMDLSQFPHDKLGYSLTGHQKTTLGSAFTCTDCHADKISSFDQKVCATCHNQINSSFISQHIAAFGLGCLTCHDGVDVYGKFDHNRVAFSLTGKHASIDCASCHREATNPANLQSTPQDCFSCHTKDDAHQNQLGQDCATCHNPADWKLVTFDHSKAPFNLVGKHITVACQDCHKDSLFKNTAQDCYSCHAKDDPHQGQLGQDCAVCHNPADWKQVTFDHSKAPFNLVGKHITVACQDCHKDNLFKNTAQDCYSCHIKDDPHQGQLGQNCASCHSPEDWKKVNFDHSQSSFPLLGKHITVECGACHADALFKNTPINCFACHAKDDKHNGQFGTECSACHTPAGWDQATFDHSKASFQLTGKHIGVDCTACHVSGKFKGTPTDCYSCHSANDAHGGSYGTDCALCHDLNGWKPAHFDHSGFPLTGAHVNVACASCHSNGQFQGTPTACSGCHNDPAYHAGLFGTACDQCHNTSAWQPAQFNRAHSFPINHGGNNTCHTCHPSTLSQFTCYSCHNKNEIIKKHLEEGIRNLGNCIGCHPGGQTRGAWTGPGELNTLFEWLNIVWGTGLTG